uniref:Angiotensin-converting enzyme n=1 Tax=Timema cristinae TaxID=61476 RepID=A0A7R9GNZ4_TIMCR|nr:unnamed protein product [Timema cristinae]
MNLGEAQQFLREYEREAAEMCFRVKQSQWNFSTNITDANKRRMLEEQALESKLDRLSWRRATSFTWTRLPDSQTRRQLNMLVTQTRAGLPDNEFDELICTSGFRDAGQQERSLYEDEEFESHIDEVWATVAPLYRQLHTYVRRRLIQQYGSQRVRPDGPIPAHLLGM